MVVKTNQRVLWPAILTMLTVTGLLLLLLLGAEGAAAEDEETDSRETDYWETDYRETDYTAEWGVEIEGGWERASRVARRHGFQLLYQLPYLENHYVLRHAEVEERSKRSADHITTRLADDSDVMWAEQQTIIEREKRDMYSDDSYRTRADKTGTCADNKEACPFNDPELPHQWYIMGDSSAGEYMTQVQDAWRRGWTGKNVVVTVVDDGLDYNNTDIQPNYDPFASWDFNSNDSDPMARPTPHDKNRHGTRCAGEVAMAANNSFCGVGIAFNSRIGGIRLLDGNITDAMEGQSLCFNHTHVDIYSLSWGPTDNGKTVDRPHRLAQKCLEKAIEKGRGGKGNIYIVASGNGGYVMDNCNCDGYASSMFTISVSSVTQQGTRPWFGERCPSSLTTTYSSGMKSELNVVTADLHNGCTTNHGGTSASAPMAAGIIALALEANANLTWRDVQHLVVLTSKAEQLTRQGGWKVNAAGFCVSLDFGFGLMDALGMVTWAEKWQPLPKRVVCESDHTHVQRDLHLPRELRSGSTVEVSIHTDGCRGQENEINYLEHVQFVFTVNYTRRGAVSAVAISPSCTEVELLAARGLDNSTENFDEWPLMSVHTWGENPAGTWIFRVEDKMQFGSNESGTVVSVKLVLYGTREAPFYRAANTSFCSLNLTRAACGGNETSTLKGNETSALKGNETSALKGNETSTGNPCNDTNSDSVEHNDSDEDCDNDSHVKDSSNHTVNNGTRDHDFGSHDHDHHHDHDSHDHDTHDHDLHEHGSNDHDGREFGSDDFEDAVVKAFYEHNPPEEGYA